MRKLRKSRNDVVFLGVLGGIAEYFNWDSQMVRLAYVILTLLGVGSPILAYFLLAMIMPYSEE
jgi:phage shock protein PspC (stress-responsive transcriptional regulator)